MTYQAPFEDEDLWKLISGGDERAYEKLFRKYYAALSGYAFGILKNEEKSEGVAQEVFIKIWEKRKELQFSTSVKAYLYRAVFNRSLNEIKKQKVRTDYRESADEKVVDESTVTNFELKYKIQEALEQLPEKCAEIFRMAKMEGMKYGEIADELGISIKTVENQMGKALKLMRTYLKEFVTIWLALINFWLNK